MEAFRAYQVSILHNVNTLEVIYKPIIICPLAIMSADTLQPDSVPFGLSINLFSLIPLHDSYDGSLYVLHSILILTNYQSQVLEFLILSCELHKNVTICECHTKITSNGKGSL